MKQIFNNIEEIEKNGFTGFLSIGELNLSKRIIPKSKGVYCVLYLSELNPAFVKKGSGGFFRGQDPNVSIDLLNSKWVDNTKVIYIGRGGQEGKQSNLHSRLSQYLRFGQGKNVGHWGGRYIFQLEYSSKLLVCWKITEEPEKLESQLLRDFEEFYGKLPFGNIKH